LSAVPERSAKRTKRKGQAFFAETLDLPYHWRIEAASLGPGEGGVDASGSAAGLAAPGTSAAWVGDASAVFELVVLSVAAFSFCRRDL